MTQDRAIKITGARTNTLKEIHCAIPHAKITVVTGPSGSGKSSLAFDTLYAEGQRRYVESMSTYARQFLERIEKPDVDKIESILPAIALEQKNRIKNARSTVGTATEVYDYLRILMAAIGVTRCDQCGGEVTRANPKRILESLQQWVSTCFEKLEKEENGKETGRDKRECRLLILAPVSLAVQSPEDLLKKGFYRLYHNQETVDLNTVKTTFNKNDTVWVVVDRLVLKAPVSGINDSRLNESIKNALVLGQGKMEVHQLGSQKTLTFQTAFACLNCQKEFTEPEPNLFSFNSPIGACPTCEGFGRIIGLDLDKVIPNPSLSLSEGAILPFTTPSNADMQDLLLREGKKNKIRLDVPYKTLNEKEKQFVLAGKGAYPGVQGFFEELESKRYKMHIRILLAKYRGFTDCSQCFGSRVRPEALNVYLNQKNILQICHLPIHELLLFFETLPLGPLESNLAQRPLKEILSRLKYLNDVGLSYLTLARQSRTLSGGESQRINLATALGGALTDTLYVLDEPTVGLHARDTDRLLNILRALRNQGNTVVVVEHDPEIILGADHIIDMGPMGGEAGGHILYEGDLVGLFKTERSLTRQFLDPARRQTRPQQSVQNKKASEDTDNTLSPPSTMKVPPWRGTGGDFKDAIEIIDAHGNNLKNLTVAFPKNRLVCVTGVSGSGKSTLIKQTLYAGYQRDKGEAMDIDLAPCARLKGLEPFADAVLVDQSPPGRSQRSNPVTYIKAYDDIRSLFSNSRKAKILGLKPGDFSFNTSGGRCEACEGLGVITIDMQFMADVTVVCSECKGRRFKQNVLSVEVDGYSIHDVLNMSVDAALIFFKQHPGIQKKLQPLHDIGLGYLKLGQATSTLSGGEAQRLKLAGYLRADGNSGRNAQPYLFLFDEPTTGLHLSDIHLLVGVFRRLVAAGHSMIVIEHNLDFVAQADYILDMGPEGGEMGGQIVAEGSVRAIMDHPESYTGLYLKKHFSSLPQLSPNL